jgi:protein TonB
VAEAPPPAETLTARDVPMARAPDADTPRPQPRIARPEPPPRAAPPAPQGSAAQTARAGDARGAAQGNATRTQQGDRGQASSDGQAVGHYPQLVNRHLSRLRRPNTRFDGAAVVAFTVAGNGGLAGVSIMRTSGNAEFDRLALAHIQRAAPFPPPPAGAQRSFNVTVQGR